MFMALATKYKDKALSPLFLCSQAQARLRRMPDRVQAVKIKEKPKPPPYEPPSPAEAEGRGVKQQG